MEIKWLDQKLQNSWELLSCTSLIQIVELLQFYPTWAYNHGRSVDAPLESENSKHITWTQTLQVLQQQPTDRLTEVLLATAFIVQLCDTHTHTRTHARTQLSMTEIKRSNKNGCKHYFRKTNTWDYFVASWWSCQLIQLPVSVTMVTDNSSGELLSLHRSQASFCQLVCYMMSIHCLYSKKPLGDRNIKTLQASNLGAVSVLIIQWLAC